MEIIRIITHQQHLGSFNNGPKQGTHGVMVVDPLIIANKFKPATVKIANVSTMKIIIISTENELFRELHIVDMSEEHFLLVNTHTYTHIYIFLSLSLSLSLYVCVCGYGNHHQHPHHLHHLGSSSRVTEITFFLCNGCAPHCSQQTSSNQQPVKRGIVSTMKFISWLAQEFFILFLNFFFGTLIVLLFRVS
jgi:hypothetical protein